MFGLGLGLGGPDIQGFDGTLVEGFIGLLSGFLCLGKGSVLPDGFGGLCALLTRRGVHEVRDEIPGTQGQDDGQEDAGEVLG